MKVFAAIDLRGGDAVQLVGGDPAAERVRLPDPAAVARQWLEAGFRHLHVVDLDAALGAGSNDEGILAVTGTVADMDYPEPHEPVLTQVGGGVRDRHAIERVLGLGADRVIVGTRAVEERDWLETMAEAMPGRLVVAADVRDGVVVTRGWRHTTSLPASDFVASLTGLPLAAVLVTDVGREGRQEGIDGSLFTTLATACPHPLMAAGGIAGPADLMALRDAGAHAAILGMALYTGRIDPAEALEMETA